MALGSESSDELEALRAELKKVTATVASSHGHHQPDGGSIAGGWRGHRSCTQGSNGGAGGGHSSGESGESASGSGGAGGGGGEGGRSS